MTDDGIEFRSMLQTATDSQLRLTSSTLPTPEGKFCVLKREKGRVKRSSEHAVAWGWEHGVICLFVLIIPYALVKFLGTAYL